MSTHTPSSRFLIAFALILSFGMTGFVSQPAQAAVGPALSRVAGVVVAFTFKKAGKEGAKHAFKKSAQVAAKKVGKEGIKQTSKQALKKAASLSGKAFTVWSLCPEGDHKQSSEDTRQSQ